MRSPCRFAAVPFWSGGTGLGLAIVKHIAEVHGAALSLESDEDAGTTITVDFPQRQQS